MKHWIFRLLNIHPSEAGVVSNLFAIQFFLVSGSSFLFITGNAIFLARLSVNQLPLALILTGIALLLFNKLFHQVSKVLSERALMIRVVTFCIAITGLLALVNYIDNPWMSMALFVWFNIVFLLLESVFWGLVASVFDVREGRRLFTVIGGGDIPAELIGYLSLVLIAPVIGLSNMLWITVAFFVIALGFSRRIFNLPRIRDSLANHHLEKTQFDQARHKNDRGNRLILAIAGLSLVSFSAVWLIDYLFLVEVNLRYDTDLELAYFLGLFFAGGRVLAIFIKFLLSSRFLNYVGLTGSLLLSPMMILGFLALIFGAQHYFPDMEVLLYLIGIMTLLSEILRSTIQEPVTLILFQPLRIDLRLKGHTIAQGYMYAVAVSAIGILLFAMKDPIAGWLTLLIVLAGVTIIWILFVFVVKKVYLHNLHTALSRGYLSGNSLFLEDQATIDLLLGKTESEELSEVIFALDLLEKGEYLKLDDVFRAALDRQDPVLTDYVLQRIEINDMDQFRPYLLDAILGQAGPELPAKYLRTISRLEPEDELLWSFVNNEDPEIRDASLTGLCSNHHVDYRSEVRTRLGILSQSDDEQDRKSVARIIGQSGNVTYIDFLEDLLEDGSREVVGAALVTIGSMRAEVFIPKIVSMAHRTDIRKQAVMALASMEEAAIDFFRTDSRTELKSFFIDAAAHMTSRASADYLIDLLAENDQYFSQIVRKLRLRNYQGDQASRNRIISLFRTRITETQEILGMKGILKKVKKGQACQAALSYEIDTRNIDLISLIDMAYGNEKINRAVKALLKDHQHSNALEMLEHSIPRDIFQRLSGVLEYSKYDNFPAGKGTVREILATIIASRVFIFNDWTRAVSWQLARELRMETDDIFGADEKKDLPHILRELIDLPILK